MPSTEPSGAPRLLPVAEMPASVAHRSIGEVLALLQDEFPDISISKIRFLEAQGLIEPERTPSGYRRFYPRDVVRLRWVLRQQRENFLPLKVIKERLDSLSDDAIAAELDAAPRPPHVVLPEPALFASRPGKPAAAPAIDVEAVEEPPAPPTAPARTAARRKTKRRDNEQTLATVNAAELSSMLQVAPAFVTELERYGLLVGSVVGDETLYDGDAVELVRVAAQLQQHGIDPRHLRMYRLAVDREMGVYEQVLAPQLRQHDRDRNRQVGATLAEFVELGDSIRRILIARASRPFQ